MHKRVSFCNPCTCRWWGRGGGGGRWSPFHVLRLITFKKRLVATKFLVQRCKQFYIFSENLVAILQRLWPHGVLFHNTMPGQHGDSAQVSNSLVSARLQFRHWASQNVMRIISQANPIGPGAVWISDLCSRSFRVTRFFFLQLPIETRKSDANVCSICQHASLEMLFHHLRSPSDQ